MRQMKSRSNKKDPSFGHNWIFKKRTLTTVLIPTGDMMLLRVLGGRGRNLGDIGAKVFV